MKFTSLVLVLSIFILISVNAQLEAKYHTNEELHEYMINFTIRFPYISTVYSIGQSVRGVELLVLKLTTTEDLLAPNVKLVGNIHGNEAISREVLLQFIELIGTSYNVNSTFATLLNTTILHILPSLNPDGFSRKQIGLCQGSVGRDNANEVDLNRNYPDYFTKVKVIEQPETFAIKQWLNTTRFALSAAFHSGTLVANYPFDSPKHVDSGMDTEESIAPDDDILKHLALVYAKSHTRMQNPNECSDDFGFVNGITNGAKWYEIQGGMGDYNYAFGGVMELTLEISCCKFPMTREIGKIFDENKAALIAYVSEAQRGVRGTIVDYNIDMKLQIKGRDIPFYPDSMGRFWRILLPGRYTLLIIQNNTIQKSVPFSVNNSSATILHLEMSKKVTEKNESTQGTKNIIEDSNVTSTTLPTTKAVSEFISPTTSTPKKSSNAIRLVCTNYLLLMFSFLIINV